MSDSNSFTIDTHSLDYAVPRDRGRDTLAFVRNLIDRKRDRLERYSADPSDRVSPSGDDLNGLGPNPTGAGQAGYAVNLADTYAAIYNSSSRYFYYFFDEALRDSWQNALAMYRDTFMSELLYHRQLPTVCLAWHIDHDDPDDKEQVKVVQQISRVVESTGRFYSLKKQLLDATFYGRSGAQLLWDRKRIGGYDRVYIKDFMPVNGDKIQFKFDMTPGIMINSGSAIANDPRYQPYIGQSTLAQTLYLEPSWLRDRFIVHKFEPRDSDFIFEGDKALGSQGMGMRDRLYGYWNMRAELMGWEFDALQRIGVNGMLFGLYESGNSAEKAAIEKALTDLVVYNVCAFPVVGGQPGKPMDHIGRIEPSPVGYDVLFNLILHLEGIMRRCMLGQNLSSESAPTGLGSGLSELQGDMFQNIIMYDSGCLGETIDHQLLAPIVTHNYWQYRGKTYRGDDLPFGVRYKGQIDRQNVKDVIEAAARLFEMGVDLDGEDLRDKAGLSAPKNPETTISKSKLAAAMPSPSPDDSRESGATQEREGVPESNGKLRLPFLAGIPEKYADDSFLMERYAADSEHAGDDPGVMIAFILDDKIAESLAVPDGNPADELHVTLCYLGRVSEIGHDMIEFAQSITRMLSEATPPLSGRLSGLGRFVSDGDESNNMDVIYSSVDVPGLAEFRSELVKVLEMGEVPYKKDHGFTPHVTLTYLPSGQPYRMERFRPRDVSFGRVSFVIGGKVVGEYTMSGRSPNPVESEIIGDAAELNPEIHLVED